MHVFKIVNLVDVKAERWLEMEKVIVTKNGRGLLLFACMSAQNFYNIQDTHI